MAASGGKVLVMLNDASEARAVCARLSEAGVDTVTAPDGISGIAAMGETRPDVVLCSRDLPKMDGLEVCRLIKRNHKLKHVAVLVVLDENDDADTVSTTLEVGANDYVQRPIRMAELVVAVRSHLQSKTSIARLKDDNKELATILEISEMLTSTLNSTDLFYIIVHKVAEALAVDTCTLLRLDATGKTATIEASMSPDDAETPLVQVADLPEVRRCLAGGKMVYVEDARRDAELAQAHAPEGALSVLAVPLQLRQAAAGRFVFRMARRGDPFTYREIKFCQIVTTVAGNALENACLYESLEIAHTTLTEIAKKDPLTDLFNRRFLFERLEVELARSLRRRAPMAVVLLDIDHFKRINDDQGHQAGDAVLIGFAKILKDCVRGQDLVGRYGGEEFLVVLPETDRNSAMVVAERIRRAVREHCFPEAERQVTASLGIAVHAPEEAAPDVETLVSSADKALYEAKNSGRDRAVLHEAAAAACPEHP